MGQLTSHFRYSLSGTNTLTLSRFAPILACVLLPLSWALCEMNEIDEKIEQLKQDCAAIELPDSVVSHHYSMILIESRLPDTLSKIPNPYRQQVIDFGLSLSNEWYFISNNATEDYSEYAPKLHELVIAYVSGNKQIT